MRNVYKGFQMAKMALPKVHQANMNKAFNIHHAPTLKRPAIRIEKQQMPKVAKKPGRNPGVKY